MDFTYLVAFALSVLVGFAIALALIIAGRTPNRKHYRIGVAGVIATDYLLLINWSAITLNEIWILAVDLAFFTIYGCMGIAIGMLPVIAAVTITRRLRR